MSTGTATGMLRRGGVRALLVAAGLALGAGSAPAEDRAEEGEYSVPIETWQMDNGARVYFVHRPSLPMVSVRATFDAGSARDPEGRHGLSALVARMLNEGAGDLSSDAFAREVDGLGLDFEASSSRDTFSVQVTSLTSEGTEREALDLMALALRDPVFPEEALQRERQRQIISIRRDREDPQTEGVKAFFRAVYGDHPYAHPGKGIPEHLREIGREDLQEFAEDHFVGANATIAVVGDLEQEDARQLLADTLGGLPEGSRPEPLPEVPELEGPQQVFLERDVTQAHVLMGQPAIRRGGEDYFPLLVGNYSLGGGGFASRLVGAVREERGLSYSVFSTFRGLQRRGPFVAGLQTANENLAKALDVLQGEVKEFVQDGPTEEEVEAAQRYLTGSFPLDIAGNKDIVSNLGTMGFYDLGEDYLERYIPRVRAVDEEAIRAAMDGRLDPERMVTVVVGAERPEGFEEVETGQ
ncbi:MAG: M16 family metallopeptidase [Thiohalorhabdus sp.]|uniref:M16 family metallopeptidase n=1 Tax=Thiohalorhabdus sp. TaxID=3094134 RepID=UPI003980A0C4